MCANVSIQFGEINTTEAPHNVCSKKFNPVFLFQIPKLSTLRWLGYSPRQQIELKIQAVVCGNRRATRTILLQRFKDSVFIQADKPVYKPRQKSMIFEVFSITFFFIGRQNMLTIYIDPTINSSTQPPKHPPIHPPIQNKTTHPSIHPPKSILFKHNIYYIQYNQ